MKKRQTRQYSVYRHLFQQQSFKWYSRDTVFTPFALPKVSYVRDPNSLVTVDLTTLVSKYNTALEKIYNDLAPMKSRWITHRPHAPWYNDDLRLAKRIKWRAERMFRKTGLEVHKEIFGEACNNYQKQLEFHKTSYYKSKIERAGRNKLF